MNKKNKSPNSKQKFKNLTTIAEKLKDSKGIQMIYAFNGTGKTRLSYEFKNLIAPNSNGIDQDSKLLYYNAFIEDLFYWKNDFEYEAEPKLIIQKNSFTKWVLNEQGQENNIIDLFKHYANTKITPKFNEQYSEVIFTLATGDDKTSSNIKISKGEESIFIWCIFYTLIKEMSLDGTEDFKQLEYVFIDDPVSSLDENNLIELAVDLAQVINDVGCNSQPKFIITTHNPLFYNVLYNECSSKIGYLLERSEDGSYNLPEKKGDSNTSFSYHLYLKKILEKAVLEDCIEKFHFMLLRNLYEKTANFLGYPRWGDLLPEEGKKQYLKRIIQFSSHRTLSSEEVAQPNEQDKTLIKSLLEHLTKHYKFSQSN